MRIALRPSLVAHADWSTNADKRWMAVSRKDGESYKVMAPERVGEVGSLVRRLADRANGRPVLVGFDFPIGVPEAFARAAGITGFLEALPKFDAEFYSIATARSEISFRRPFYPLRPGGTRQAHLTTALGVHTARELLRVCERGSPGTRNDACILFWTLGAKQVGRAAIVGWRDLIAPALANQSLKVGLWPFRGPLGELLDTNDCVIVETYPAEACLHLGISPPGRGWSKRNQVHRKRNGGALIAWAEKRRVVLSEPLAAAIRDGFGNDDFGEDLFDSVVGLMSMLEVVLGHRLDGVSQENVVRRIEG